MNLTRDESFVPLTPAGAPANERPDYRVTVRTHPENVQPFHSFGQNATTPAAGASANLEPRLTFQRDGERITAIRLQCTCGHVIELDCVYEPAPSPAPGPAPAIPAPAGSLTPPAVAPALNPDTPPPAATAAPTPAARAESGAKPKAVAEKPAAKKVAPRSRR
jgi:hypothetical protein